MCVDGALLTGSGDGAILHVLTGVKRLSADNTAVSGTPSPDNYITLILHCFHSLLIISLKSKWLESRWQRDEWQRGSRRREPCPLHIWLNVLKCIHLLSGNHGAVQAHKCWNAILNAGILFWLPSKICPFPICSFKIQSIKCLTEYTYIFIYFYPKCRYKVSVHNGCTSNKDGSSFSFFFLNVQGWWLGHFAALWWPFVKAPFFFAQTGWCSLICFVQGREVKDVCVNKSVCYVIKPPRFCGRLKQ